LVPITFLTQGSHFSIDSFIRDFINVTFDFRTFNKEGLLVDHSFSQKGRFQVCLEKGRLIVYLIDISNDEPALTLNPFPSQALNDGLWHYFFIHIETNKIIVHLDKQRSYTTKIISVQSGIQYTFGGGVYGKPGFIGCIRRLAVQNSFILLNSLRSLKTFESNPKELLIEKCQMIDRCHPNPCEHGSICRQDNNDYSCDCSSTGYTGAVCHSPKNPVSCDAFKIEHTSTSSTDILIDVDGSGPLEPFKVTCKFFSDRPTVTILHHKNEATTHVEGYQAPGSFRQDIIYNADFDQIEILVNKSYTCKQFLRYDCFNARLFNTPNSEAEFNPSTWWISRNNQKMSYWGGSLPKSRKCSCGISATCDDPNTWCNCDSQMYRSKWMTDEGDISEKEYLPIRSILVGDTETTSSLKKQARYTIGPLHCEGDNVFENVVTFRQLDSLIPLPLLEIGLSADVYFQFKTTAESGVFVHLAGSDDYIKLSLIGQKTIQLSFDVGYGQQKVEVESNKLNDDNWHSVNFEWNRREVKLMIDGKASKSIENKRGSFRPFNISSKWVVGATVDEKEGYVGCMRALSINGHFVDLKSIVTQGMFGRPLYGVILGCVGKCTSNPCLNNGTCHDYYSSYICDCQWTVFKGRICADEIGVTLRSDNYIKYDFEEKISTLEERIRVGFTTTEHKGLIIGVTSETGEYLNLVMSTSGNLRLIFDFGFERQELIIKNENFALGQHHDVTIARFDKGTKMSITVNNYEPIIYTFKIADKADAHFNFLKSIYIGRNESMTTGEGFVGCISRVSFDDHFPLRRLFQENRRANVEAFPSLDSVREDTCGIESVTHPPEIIETRPPPISSLSQVDNSALGVYAIFSIVAGSLLFIILLGIGALILSGRFAAQQKGDYKTYEDKGARDALDPDAAVMKGKIFFDTSKKKEYFI